MRKLCVLNYGSGNIGSVCNMLRYLNIEFDLLENSKHLDDYSHFILPGVGAFEYAMTKIDATFGCDVLENKIKKTGKMFLGICVGMQILANEGKEFGNHKGLGWIPGDVRLIQVKQEILPHIGWNNLSVTRNDTWKEFDNVDFYFVHSYCYDLVDKKQLVASAHYGEEIPAIINKDNLWGVQFHPEKSLLAGQKLMKKFVEL